MKHQWEPQLIHEHVDSMEERRQEPDLKDSVINLLASSPRMKQHTHTKTLYDKGNGTSVHGVSFLINNTVLLHTMDVKTLKPSRFLITRRSLLREHCGFAFSWHLKWHIWPLWAIRCDLTTAATFKARKTKTLKRTDATSCLSLQQIQWKLFVNRSHIYSRIHPAVPDGSLVEVYLSCKLI